MLFPKKDLICLIQDDEEEVEYLKLISTRPIENRRWVALHLLLFQDRNSGKFYGTEYEVGLTEHQQITPFENGGEQIECREYERFEKLVISYRPVGSTTSNPR